MLDIYNTILPGDNIMEAIYKGISESDMVLVILSKANNGGEWFSSEIGIIISEIRNHRYKKVIPILKDRDSVIPPFIDQYQFLDASDGKTSLSNLSSCF